MEDTNDSLFSKEIFKKKLIDAFKYTICFLDEHNLSWFVGGGTCIGTIRHKGLIPWDDDIDIFMPREDYQRLISIREEMNGSGYELVSWETNKTMIPFAKVINRKTSIWEIKYHPYMSGVFVDIFPMDLSDKGETDILNDLKNYNDILRRYQASLSDYSIKDLLQLLLCRRLHFFREGLLSFFTRRNTGNYLTKMKDIEIDNKSDGGAHYVLFSACFAYAFEKEIFKREWFDTFVMMPFEGIQVRVPIGYDAYLKHVYGDYMKLPPKEKRITRHYHYYINLQEKKSIEEVRDIKLKEKSSNSILPL